MVSARLLVLVVVLVASGCNGHGGGDGDEGSQPVASSSPAAPAAPVVSVSSTIKSLEISWGPVAGVTHYRVLERSSGSSAYAQVGANLAASATSHRLDIAVHLKDWIGSRYIVQACNAGGCTDSAAVDVATHVLSAIGVVKASDTAAGDQFGAAIAISGDGTTLAIGAPFERSGAQNSVQGVNGEQADDCVSLGPNCEFNSGAVYVYVRGTGGWTQQAFIKRPTPDGGDMFGTSVALSDDGNLLAVGVPGQDSAVYGSGAVHLYARSGASWSYEASVTATNPGFENYFGRSVALSGNGEILVVGAPHEGSAEVGVHAANAGNQTNDCNAAPAVNCSERSGAVYVYTRSSGWSAQKYIKPYNTSAADEFGTSLALSSDGRVLAVGSVMQAGVSGGLQQGAVYLFDGASDWAQLQMLKATYGDHDDRFGATVSLSADGETLVVGADGEDSNYASDPSINAAATYNAGAVYVYMRVSGVWQNEVYLKAPNIGGGDKFGAVVSLSSDGNMLAVGAPMEDSAQTSIGSNQGDDTAGDNSGAVYIYTRSNSAWTLHRYVKAPNTDVNDEFGSALALSADGDTLVVGGSKEDSNQTGVNSGDSLDNNSAANAGAAYLY